MGNLRLKMAIIANGQTQLEFAKQIGVTELVISRIITGRKIASSELRKTIAETLEKPESEIFEEGLYV